MPKQVMNPQHLILLRWHLIFLGTLFSGLRVSGLRDFRCGPRDLPATLHNLDKSEGMSGGAAADPRGVGADSPWKGCGEDGRKGPTSVRLLEWLHKPLPER